MSAQQSPWWCEPPQDWRGEGEEEREGDGEEGKLVGVGREGKVVGVVGREGGGEGSWWGGKVVGREGGGEGSWWGGKGRWW